MIADDTVVVGSLNWVQSAATDNREVLVALEGSEAAEYYAAVFGDDWENGRDRTVPTGVLAAAAATAGGALLFRRLSFVGRETVTDWQW